MYTLKKTRKILKRPDDWCQGDYHIGQASCMLGAIEFAQSRFADKTVDLLENSLGNKSLAGWNDVPRRKHSEILRLLDKNIKFASAHAST